jgi:hypothetical protein
MPVSSAESTQGRHSDIDRALTAYRRASAVAEEARIQWRQAKDDWEAATKAMEAAEATQQIRGHELLAEVRLSEALGDATDAITRLVGEDSFGIAYQTENR